MDANARTVTKRTRKSFKRSKNSCRTCRIRRVKCDEQRPICSRCRNFGVDCDGFQSQPIQSYTRPLSQAPPLLPTPPIRSKNALLETSNGLRKSIQSNSSIRQLLQSSLTFTPFSSDSEARYFDLFYKTTVDAILPHCQATLHSPMLWGASFQPSLRHAIVALAALHEASTTAQNTTSLPSEYLNLSVNKHHQNAIEHYSKAIKAMRSHSKEDLRTILITCFMIFGFEAYHGNLSLALSQLQIGIALIETWKEERSQGIGCSKDLDGDILESFVSLEIQMIGFRDMRGWESHARLRREYADQILGMPRTFKGVKEAQKYLQMILKQIWHLRLMVSGPMLFYREGDEGTGHTILEPPREELIDISSYLSHHRTELSHWNSSFRHLIHQSLPTNHIPNLEQQTMTNYAQLHYATTTLLLETIPPPAQPPSSHEMIYDSHTEAFAHMLSLAEKLTHAMKTKITTSSPTNPSHPSQTFIASHARKSRFHIDTSIIFPLYFIALKCRVKRIRRKAIELLMGEGREGVWDAGVVGRVCEWVGGVEGGGGDGEEIEGGDNGDHGDHGVPGWKRVERVWFGGELRERRVSVGCWVGGRKGREFRAELVW